MFGLFKKRAEAENDPDDNPGAEAERPRPPSLGKFVDPAAASAKDLRSALLWASDWTGENLGDPSALRPQLEGLLAGDRFPRKAFEGRDTLRMALRIIQLSAQRNRAKNTARAMPKALFHTGPQDTPCKAARQRDGRVFTVARLPTIPLAKCDQRVCKCHFRSITAREAERRG